MLIKMLIQSVVAGLLTGLTYALIASGLNLILGVMNVVNMAHGEFIMLSAFSAYWLFSLFAIPPFVSLVVNVTIMFLAGIVIYNLTVRILLKSEDPPLASFLCYYGLSLFLSGLALMVWGPEFKSLPFSLPITSIEVMGYFFSATRVLTSMVSLVAMVILLFFLYRTYLGKAVRATIQNRNAIMLLGINVHVVCSISLAIGLALTSVAGTLVPLIYPAINPFMGLRFTMGAVASIVLGGLGKPLGGIIGGITYAMVENVAMIFVPAGASPLISFSVLALMIMVRPEGILGSRRL